MVRRSFFALLALLLWGGGAARAAGLTLGLEPFAGMLARDAWQSVTVTVSSPPDGPSVSGEVQLVVGDFRPERGLRGIWSRALRIAPGETRRETFVIPLEPAAVPRLEVRVLRGNGMPVARRTFEGVLSRPDNEATILSLSRRTDLYRSASDKVVEQRDYMPRRHTRIRLLSPTDLPTDPLALEAITAVFADESLPPTGTAEGSLLQRYVAAGGILVRPGTTTRNEWVGAGTLAWLRPDDTGAWERALAFPDRGLISRLARPARNVGMGGGFSEAVLVGNSVEPPHVSLLILFLGTYLLVLVPVQYVVLRRLGRREWAWGVTPALAVLFAVAAFVFGQHGRSRESYLSAATVVEAASGSGRGTALVGLGLFAAKPGSYSFGLESGAPVHLWPQRATAVVAETDRSAVIRDMSVPMWTMAQAAARTEVTLGEGVHVTSLGDRRVRIVNRTGRLLRDVTVTGDYGLAIGWVERLAAGQSTELALLESGGPIRGQRVSFLNEGTGADSTDRMKSHLSEKVEYGLKQVVSGREITLTGWLAAPPIALTLDGKTVEPRHHATLLVVRASR